MAHATVCAICCQPPTITDPLTRGHIVALANGGTNHPSNYQAEHETCNKRKGTKATGGEGYRRSVLGPADTPPPQRLNKSLAGF